VNEGKETKRIKIQSRQREERHKETKLIKREKTKSDKVDREERHKETK
jgi:hypothetical protein